MLCNQCWPNAHFISGLACDACGVPLAGDATPETVYCEACHLAPPNWKRGRAVGLYQGPLRKMALALKHGDRHDIARPMAEWMAPKCAELLTPDTIIAPVPLHWSRMLRRRFNQSVLIARHLAAKNSVPMIPDLLLRNRATKMQKGMTRDERFENQRAAICINPKQAHRGRGKSILVVDDVMTTGATLSACTEACLTAAPDLVNIAVFARVAPVE